MHDVQKKLAEVTAERDRLIQVLAGILMRVKRSTEPEAEHPPATCAAPAPTTAMDELCDFFGFDRHDPRCRHWDHSACTCGGERR